MRQTIENKVAYRVRGKGGGWAFSPRDFLDLGGRPTVDSALHRLAQRGDVRRVIRGIYDYPRFSHLLGQRLSPDIDQVARAIARKFGWRIQPSGATALNLLGVSTQVPARAISARRNLSASDNGADGGISHARISLASLVARRFVALSSEARSSFRYSSRFRRIIFTSYSHRFSSSTS